MRLDVKGRARECSCNARGKGAEEAVAEAGGEPYQHLQRLHVGLRRAKVCGRRLCVFKREWRPKGKADIGSVGSSKQGCVCLEQKAHAGTAPYISNTKLKLYPKP